MVQLTLSGLIYVAKRSGFRVYKVVNGGLEFAKEVNDAFGGFLGEFGPMKVLQFSKRIIFIDQIDRRVMKCYNTETEKVEVLHTHDSEILSFD